MCFEIHVYEPITNPEEIAPCTKISCAPGPSQESLVHSIPAGPRSVSALPHILCAHILDANMHIPVLNSPVLCPFTAQLARYDIIVLLQSMGQFMLRSQVQTSWHDEGVPLRKECDR